MSNYKDTVIIITSVLIVFSLGWYLGKSSGYENGASKGVVAGFAIGQSTAHAETMALNFQKSPENSKHLISGVCLGFRAALPCQSLADGERMALSADPIEHFKGQSCVSTLQTLGDCGAEPAKK